MILAHGRLYENGEQSRIIASLQQEICDTLAGLQLSMDEVIAACDRLSKRAMAGAFDETALPLLELVQVPYETYLNYCRMFSAEELRNKVKMELGGLPERETLVREGEELQGSRTLSLYKERRPLGVLLHIAAGNIDVLPAYSVMEGLLAGNINILKLPTGDSGVSVKLLQELIREYPALNDYIYVFDVPSVETNTIKLLAEVADGVVIWGGDAAIRAAHQFVKPNTKLIAWGHKLSFAYAAADCPEELLEQLARDICRTNQLLCNSCQGIYVDTEDPEELSRFGLRFFEALKRANAAVEKAPRGMRAKNTLKLYTDHLEGAALNNVAGSEAGTSCGDDRKTILSEEGVSVIIGGGEELELSYTFRNVWIKALPGKRIIHALKHQKGYLQSCALLLPEGRDREEVMELLKRAGLTRITGAAMSETVIGEAHDGRLPLQEYSRIVDVQR